MSGHYIAKSDDLDKNYDELQAQVEAMRDQKPVAWVCINEDGECEQIDFGAESPLPGDEGFVPLYLHPAPIPAEQIAEIKRKERERCAVVCATSEVPIDIDVWAGTKKEISAATAIALAAAIRSLENKPCQ